MIEIKETIKIENNNTIEVTTINNNPIRIKEITEIRIMMEKELLTTIKEESKKEKKKIFF